MYAAYYSYGKAIKRETTRQNEYLETATRSVFSWRDTAFFANFRTFLSIRADCTKTQNGNNIFIVLTAVAGNVCGGVVFDKG